MLCHLLRRSDADCHRRVSPHSERRSLQPHNDAIPETEAQEQKAPEGAEEAHAPPADPRPDCLSGGWGSHQTGESRGAHTASKYWPQVPMDACRHIFPRTYESIWIKCPISE